MRIFYTASFQGKSKYQWYFDKILEALKETNFELISPEAGNYKSILGKNELKKNKTEKEIHYAAIKKGIEWADLIIIESSNEDFQIGYETHLAIQNKKHTLCMSLNENFEDKISSRFFHGVKYTKYNVKQTIKDFINKYQGELFSERFNCFLSNSQVKFLEDESKRLKLTMSEYIRTLIDGQRFN